MNDKYFLTFHTVFILNENIKWLEEFLIYYINVLGVEHFYLYDNDKSTGGDGTTNNNKYGFSINTNNNNEDIKMFEDIKKKYHKYITHIIWQPLDENGNIIYGQNESIIHYINNYGNNSIWTCFLDLDEFIYSSKNLYLPYYLKNLNNNISCVKLCQKKFLDRFLSKQKYITHDFNCIDLNIDFEWAPKNIIKNSDYISIISIHIINVSNNILYEKSYNFRFNHYNTNNKLLEWMKIYYNSNTDFKLNSYDDGMLKYNYLFKDLYKINENFININQIINNNYYIYIICLIIIIYFIKKNIYKY
jgi:hypothetical protein